VLINRQAASASLLAIVLLGRALAAQHATSDSTGLRATIRAQAIALVTRVDPTPNKIARTEGYLAQPIIAARAAALGGHVEGILTLNFEGWTLDRGQLTPGSWGEGYVDRRHPHTYLHEAIVLAGGAFGGIGVSLAGGKGFVPFGTDDPMMRPFAAYPVNHHLAQILERYVIVGAVRRGPVSLEGSVFNGDEPLSPGSPPDASRFGDSWSARATATIATSLELQGSYAFVTSPEIVEGGGLDQRKWSTAARFERESGPVRYAMAEFALTEMMLGDFRANRFSSGLAEAATVAHPFTIALRYENTTRPEELRLLDPFRTSRSPTDLSIIGITRWQTLTASMSAPKTFHRFDVAPFAEATYARPTDDVKPSAFIPREVYGSSSQWTFSAGFRLGAGTMQHRMGRYGVARPNETLAHDHAGH
jgi:hypothetical protein